jgi:hypothetical protein
MRTKATPPKPTPTSRAERPFSTAYVTSVELRVRTITTMSPDEEIGAWFAWGLDRSLQTHCSDARASERSAGSMYGASDWFTVTLPVTAPCRHPEDVFAGGVRLLAIAATVSDATEDPVVSSTAAGELSATSLTNDDRRDMERVLETPESIELVCAVAHQHRLVSTLVGDAAFRWCDLHCDSNQSRTGTSANGGVEWYPAAPPLFAPIRLFIDLQGSVFRTVCVHTDVPKTVVVADAFLLWCQDVTSAGRKESVRVLKEASVACEHLIDATNNACFRLARDNCVPPSRMPFNKSFMQSSSGSNATSFWYLWNMTEPHFDSTATPEELPLHPATLLASAWHQSPTQQPWPQRGCWRDPPEDAAACGVGARLEQFLLERAHRDAAGDERAWGLHPLVAESLALRAEKLDPEQPEGMRAVKGLWEGARAPNRLVCPLLLVPDEALPFEDPFLMDTLVTWLCETVTLDARAMPYTPDLTAHCAHGTHHLPTEEASLLPQEASNTEASTRTSPLAWARHYTHRLSMEPAARKNYRGSDVFAPVGVDQLHGLRTWGDDCESTNGHAFKVFVALRTMYLTLVWWAKSSDPVANERAKHWCLHAPTAVLLGRVAVEYEPALLQTGIVANSTDLNKVSSGFSPEEYAQWQTFVSEAEKKDFLLQKKPDTDVLRGRSTVPKAPRLYHREEHPNIHADKLASHMTTMLFPRKGAALPSFGAPLDERGAFQAQKKVHPRQDTEKTAHSLKQAPRPRPLPLPVLYELSPRLLECTEIAAFYQGSTPKEGDGLPDEKRGAFAGSDRQAITRIFHTQGQQRPAWRRRVNLRATMDLDFNMYAFVLMVSMPGAALPPSLGGVGCGVFQVHGGVVPPSHSGASHAGEFPRAVTSPAGVTSLLQIVKQGFRAGAGQDSSRPHLMAAAPVVLTALEWGRSLHALRTFETGQLPTFLPMVAAGARTDNAPSSMIEDVRALRLWCANIREACLCAGQLQLQAIPTEPAVSSCHGKVPGRRLVQFVTRDFEWDDALGDEVLDWAETNGYTVYAPRHDNHPDDGRVLGRPFAVTLCPKTPFTHPSRLLSRIEESWRNVLGHIGRLGTLS